MSVSVRSSRHSQWSPLAIFAAVVVAVFLVIDSLVMIKRAGEHLSDVNVFYQSAFLLNHGSGGEIYDPRGQIFGWFRCIPPAGLAFFQPLAHFSPEVAGALWIVLNWAMLAAALVMLHRLLGRLDTHRRLYQSIFPWAAVLFVLMSLNSIQVGQFSLLFTMCWIGYLLADTRRRGVWMGLALALPTAIKIYPALMLMVPLSSKGRRAYKELGFFVLGLLLFCAIIPTLFNGARVVELSVAFLRDVVFNPAGRAAEDLMVGTVSNQGLESILLRYLTSDATFQAQYPRFLHGNWPRTQVLHLADDIRLIILVVSIGAVWRWRQHAALHPIHAALCMAALWSAVLFLIMPGPKARYAVYDFLAFLPLLSGAVAAARQNQRILYWWRIAFILLCVALILQFMPNAVRAYGCGFLGALFLWAANLWIVFRQSRVRPVPTAPLQGATIAA